MPGLLAFEAYGVRTRLRSNLSGIRLHFCLSDVCHGLIAITIHTTRPLQRGLGLVKGMVQRGANLQHIGQSGACARWGAQLKHAPCRWVHALPQLVHQVAIIHGQCILVLIREGEGLVHPLAEAIDGGGEVLSRPLLKRVKEIGNTLHLSSIIIKASHHEFFELLPGQAFGAMIPANNAAPVIGGVTLQLGQGI
jgi:hypothetical protein